MGAVQERDFFKSAIETTVLSFGLGFQLRGSIQANDFHLHDRKSFSDVDLILPEVTEDLRHQLANTVRQALYDQHGFELSVSVQPHDHQSALNPADSRLVSLSDYLRMLRSHRPVPGYADYLRAKASLLVVNEHPGQRFAQIAAAVGGAAARNALAVKLGTGETFLPESSLALLDTVTATPESEWLKKVVLAGDSSEATAWCQSELTERRSIPSWLASLMKRLLEP